MHTRTIAALAIVCAGMLLTRDAGARTRVRAALAPTTAAAAASCLAKLELKSTSEGQFEIKVRHLDPDAVYEVIVGGVRVADLATSGGGSGKVRFRTRPRSAHDLPLGFDPRDATVVVRSAAGDDVLASTFPDDDPTNDGDVVCCIPDDSGPECEDRTADACAAQGGTAVAGATSCLPNPCAGATPVDSDVVCCLPDDAGAECEDRTQTDCLAGGGMVVNATSCDPNPCAAVPPVADEIVCCLPDRGGDGLDECEDLTADACVAAGGAVSTATSCTPDPCGAATPAGGGIDDGGSGSSGGSSGGGTDDPSGHA